MAARSFSFTSESVTEGHPDKIADQVSDAVLDAVLTDDPTGRVACETLITTGLVVVAGEITTETYVDIPRLVRKTISEIGYTRAKYGFDAETCGVDRRDRRAVARHRAGHRRLLRGAARRRRPARPRRRRRPGNDVRLRLERDRRADAAADPARAQDLQAALRGAQGGRPAVPAAGREGAGDGALRGRRARPPAARRDRAHPRLDAAPRRARLGGADQARPDRARPPPDPAALALRREAARGEGLRLRQPDREVRDRRPDGRHRPDGAQDHRRHVRRRRAARRRRLLGQGSDEGRPLGGVRGALRREERRRRRASRERCQIQVAYAIGVAHPLSVLVDTLRHRGGGADAGPDRGARPRALRPAAGRDPPRPRPAPADLREDRRLRPLRPRGPRLHVGAHRQGRRAAPGRRARHRPQPSSRLPVQSPWVS